MHISRASVVVLVAGLFDLACTGSSSPPSSAKEPGTEGGPCFPNSTCMTSLTCFSNLCVNAGATTDANMPIANPDTGKNTDAPPPTTTPDSSKTSDAAAPPTTPDSSKTSDTAAPPTTPDGPTVPAVDAPILATDAGSGSSGTRTLDSTGGTVTVGGVTLTVPQGALSTPTDITIIQTSDPVPSGYEAYSPLYKFEPSGAIFAQPVTVSLPFQGDAKLATIFWSRTGTTGYERLSATIAGNLATVQVTHFSTGFVANGVEYTDPPDKSCVNERLIKGKTLSPSAVALFFEVDDCQGRPITGLTTSDFAVAEDGAKLSSEAVPTILNATGLSIFASLVIDMSSSTQSVLPQVISGAKAFVHKLQDNGNPLMVQISVEVFAGEASLTEVQAPTLDETKVLAALDSISGYKPTDPSSTNLYGAVINGLQKLTQARTTFESRNYGGALTSGYLVLFTDGGDTAGLHTQKEAITAETNDPADQVMAVGLQTVDYDPSALVALTSYGAQCTPTSCQWLITSPDQTVLDRDYSALASRIAGQRQRTYLLGYCSPKRAGQHTVSVTVGSATTTQTAAQYQFQANSFVAGCSATTFTSACGTTAAPFQCGGLGCGACDDRTSHCDMASSQCVNGCGFSQQCPSAPNASGVCTNGSCRLACSSGYADCDGNAANGCETAVPAPNYHDPSTGQFYYCPPEVSSPSQVSSMCCLVGGA